MSGQAADRLSAAVYVIVAVVALIGQSRAAVHWLGWPLYQAVPAVAVLELTAVALAARADYRRRKNEAAVAARVLSAVLATFMTAVNFVGHWLIGQHVAAAFFGVATATGYLLWLLNSADRRRDQLLAEGRIPDSAPSYGGWQWLRHPAITRRARALALRDPVLSWHESLRLAEVELRRERRNRALSRALRRRMTAAQDRLTAEIAVLTYDMDEIAARLADRADYDALTDLIAKDLTPERLAAATAPEVADTPLPEPVPDDRPVSGTGQDAQVLPYRRPTARRRSRPASRGASDVPLTELVNVLCREHCTPGQPAVIGRPLALTTLKRVYGKCASDRARDAKDAHAARHATTAGDRADGDDLESEAAVAWAR